MLDKRILKNLLDHSMRQGGDFADIFIEEKQTTVVACEDGRTDKIKSGVDVGAGIRVVYGDTTAYAYTNKVTKEALMEVADIASRAGKKAKKDLVLELNTIKVEPITQIRIYPSDVKIEDKVALVQAADKTARAQSDNIKQVMAIYADAVQQVTIANSLGRYVEDTRVRTRLSVNAIAAAGDQLQTGFEAAASTQGFELFEDASAESISKQAAQRALNLLTAKPAPAGKFPIVLAGAAGGTMVHEACGHGLEADLIQKGVSVYKGLEKQLVAAKGITVIDDGTIPYKYGSMLFDDEGTKTQKTVLIENGVLKSYMYDHLTAVKDKTNSTGNGRRESFEHKPIPRMCNTYIAPGALEPGEIIKSIKNGLLVKKMGGGQVNPINGDFVFDVAEGYWVKDGQISHAVRGATMTGNGPEVLKAVDMIGKDLGYSIGTCGKDGQGAPVSDAQPTLRIPQLLVGGTVHDAKYECNKIGKIIRI